MNEDIITYHSRYSLAFSVSLITILSTNSDHPLQSGLRFHHVFKTSRSRRTTSFCLKTLREDLFRGAWPKRMSELRTGQKINHDGPLSPKEKKPRPVQAALLCNPDDHASATRSVVSFLCVAGLLKEQASVSPKRSHEHGF
jgi:hypothetical protein